VGHNLGVTTTTAEAKKDAVLLAAVDHARAAAVDEVGEAMVGEHLGAPIHLPEPGLSRLALVGYLDPRSS
jgi:hypothetical protein